MGLVNRVVPTGSAREAAERLAAALASLPQTCLRNDRLSAIESLSLGNEQAMANEYSHGLTSLEAPELAEAVASFQAGTGRHGGPASPQPTGG
jgi:enoyl-CoA hydratase